MTNNQIFSPVMPAWWRARVVDKSTVDWYGNISLIVFFAGCNFRCPYCHNSGLIPMDSGEEVDLDYLRQRILINMTPVPLLDSVVLTGGEPTLQAEAVLEVAGLVRELGLKLMLDTNGSVPEAIMPLLEAGLVDRVALDIKAPLNPTDYEQGARAYLMFSITVPLREQSCYSKSYMS